MAICRPSPSAFFAGYLKWVIGLREVVDQGVEPDIDCLGTVIWNRDSPAQPLHWSRYGEILQTRLYVLDDLFHSRRRLHEVWISVVEL